MTAPVKRMVALATTTAIRYHRPAPIREKTRLLPLKPTHGALPDQKDADAATHTSAPTKGPWPHTKKTGAGGPSPPGRVAEHSEIPGDARTVAHTPRRAGVASGRRHTREHRWPQTTTHTTIARWQRDTLPDAGQVQNFFF